MAKSRFRKLLLTSVAVTLLGIPVSLVSERFLPAPLIAYLDSQMEGDITAIEITAVVTGLLFIALAIWNMVGLYRFKLPARPIAIVLTILGLFVWLLFGPIVESPIARIVSDASMLLWGAIMATMYCSPFDDLFH